MEIRIDDSIKLSEIQTEFNKHFPFLKLEFFEYDPTGKAVFTKENLINDTQQALSKIRHIHTPGHISLNGHQKVSTFEQHFRENLGVNIQVFRKSANAWLQTTSTDDWTLAEQNKKGEEMNHPVDNATPEDFEEYNEMR
ncbi:MAG: hypothetical protein IPP64_08920 [Bacteroidetes bacterium]|nr:hypothetical protein [Bacteroidota bacterium]